MHLKKGSFNCSRKIGCKWLRSTPLPSHSGKIRLMRGDRDFQSVFSRHFNLCQKSEAGTLSNLATLIWELSPAKLQSLFTQSHYAESRPEKLSEIHCYRKEKTRLDPDHLHNLFFSEIMNHNHMRLWDIKFQYSYSNEEKNYTAGHHIVWWCFIKSQRSEKDFLSKPRQM